MLASALRNRHWTCRTMPLKKGWEAISTDKLSGMKVHKFAFGEMMGKLSEGDTMVIWKLDVGAFHKKAYRTSGGPIKK